MAKKLYLIGSLRNPNIVRLGNTLRGLGFDVMDNWHGGGPEADDEWRRYEQERGRPYIEALYDHYATHIWEYDKIHLDSSDLGVLVLPAGRSAHIELGYLIGQGKPGFILMDAEPDRFDVMYRFATKVFLDQASLLETLRNEVGQ